MQVETFIRKLLRLKAHRVTVVETSPEQVVVEIDWLKSRALRCGVCRGRCKKVHQVEEARRWRDLSLRNLPMVLCYRPRRVRCPRCGIRVEAVPWAPLWARVTTALARAVAELARHLSWQETPDTLGWIGRAWPRSCGAWWSTTAVPSAA